MLLTLAQRVRGADWIARRPPNLNGFREWAYAKFKHDHAKCMSNYVAKYASLLENNNLSPLSRMTPCKRRHILQALANLSKYLGKYDEFKKLKQNSDIKWNSTSSVDIFKKIYSNNQNNNTLEYVLQNKKSLSWQYYFPMCVMLLTGLRTSEALFALNIISKGDFDKYYNPELSTLEHFRYPDIFIRNTKNVYISILTPTLTQFLSEWHHKPISYQGIRCALKRRHLEVKLYDTRSWYATYLRQHGIESEFIDLVQGRIPSSVFTRHYYKPNIQNLATKISNILEPMTQQLLK